MTSDDLTARALRTVSKMAREAGLRVADPVVLSDSSNLIVHLQPAPVVARVATVTARLREGDAWFRNEVAVATHLASAGAPVVPPSAEMEPGPHLRDGLTITLWEYARPDEGPLDAERAGRGLRDCHEALATFAGGLDPLARLRETEALTTGSLCRRALEVRERVEALDLPMQAVHGDGHLGNVVNTARGPLWNDWEDTHLAPVEWDLACLRWSRYRAESVAAAWRGYGHDPEPAVLKLFATARSLQIEAWIAAAEGPVAPPGGVSSPDPGTPCP